MAKLPIDSLIRENMHDTEYLRTMLMGPKYFGTAITTTRIGLCLKLQFKSDFKRIKCAHEFCVPNTCDQSKC